MALNLIVAVLDRGPDSVSDMAVLLAIADSADKDTGEAWPCHATIARRARLTPRGVRKVLERLRAAGWLSWDARKRANGATTSNVYTLNLRKLGEASEARVVRHEPRVGRGNRVPPPPGTRFHPPPEHGSPYGVELGSSLEPYQKEPVRGAARRSPPVGGGGPVPVEVTQRGVVRSWLCEGRPVLVGGSVVKPGTAEHARLSALALAAARAERDGTSSDAALSGAGQRAMKAGAA